MTIQTQVHAAVASVCPIDGISFGKIADKTTWRIDFKVEASTAQRASAQAVIDAFDPTLAEIPAGADRMLARQRDDAVDELDKAIDALPAAQQPAFRAIQKLLKG